MQIDPSYISADLSKRQDVIFKAIIRDFRKFYLNEFNLSTNYAQKKWTSMRDNYLFQSCIKSYLKVSYPDLYALSKDQTILQEDLDNFVFFFGLLFYPKDLPQVRGSRETQLKARDIKMQELNPSYQRFHQSFEKFSIKGLEQLVQSRNFCILFLMFY